MTDNETPEETETGDAPVAHTGSAISEGRSAQSSEEGPASAGDERGRANQQPAHKGYQIILARLKSLLRLEVLGLVIAILGGAFAYYSYVLDRDENIESVVRAEESQNELEEVHAMVRELLDRDSAQLEPEVTATRQSATDDYLKTASREEADLLLRSLSEDRGERAEALKDLAALAQEQEQDIGRLNAKAATTHKAVGAAAYLNDTALAVKSYEAALRLVPDDPEAMIQLGNLNKRLGNLDEAERHYTLILKGIGTTAGEWQAKALGNLGVIEGTRGNLAEAESYYRRALAIEETLDLKEGMANQLGNLGVIEQTRGNLAEAEAYHARALAINETLGRKEGMANQLGNLGNIKRIRGNLAEAEAYHKRALAIEEALDHKEGMANQLGNLGIIERTRGNLAEAEAYHKRALAIDEALESKEGIAANLGNLGNIEGTRGNLAEAESYYRRALAIEETLDLKEGMANQLGNLGIIERIRGNLERACSNWTQARDLFESLGNIPRRDRVTSWIEANCPPQD